MIPEMNEEMQEEVVSRNRDDSEVKGYLVGVCNFFQIVRYAVVQGIHSTYS